MCSDSRSGYCKITAFRGDFLEPVVVGLAMGLLAYAYPAMRSDLERAGDRFREFREQPTPELERSAREELRSAISPNERLQLLYHPWTSYVIVPLFALANAGIAIDRGFLERAFSSPITFGILFGYVAGKPLGILGASWLLTRLSHERLRPPVGWVAVAGGGTIAGIGFTVSLLVATLAFDGPQLEEAKLGILSAALCASILTWLLFRATALLPRRARIRALLGTDEPLLDLDVEVDAERDLIRYAEQLGLDIERFSSQLREHAGANRVAEDVNSADLSGVSGTPTFFINGRRHYGAYDTATLSAAVRAARARVTVATTGPST